MPPPPQNSNNFWPLTIIYKICPSPHLWKWLDKNKKIVSKINSNFDLEQVRKLLGMLS